MKLSILIPNELEPALRERATAAGVSPATYVQDVLRKALKGSPRRFSEAFLSLAGSWEDDRSTGEIAREIEERRVDVDRPPLR